MLAYQLERINWTELLTRFSSGRLPGILAMLVVILIGVAILMRARRATDDEKRELWAHINSIYRDFDEYQERTQRNIPVLICSPVD